MPEESLESWSSHLPSCSVPAVQGSPESSPSCHAWSGLLCPSLDPGGRGSHPGWGEAPLPGLLGPPACFPFQLDAPAPPQAARLHAPLQPEHLSLTRPVVSKAQDTRLFFGHEKKIPGLLFLCISRHPINSHFCIFKIY